MPKFVVSYEVESLWYDEVWEKYEPGEIIDSGCFEVEAVDLKAAKFKALCEVDRRNSENRAHYAKETRGISEPFRVDRTRITGVLEQ